MQSLPRFAVGDTFFRLSLREEWSEGRCIRWWTQHVEVLQILEARSSALTLGQRDVLRDTDPYHSHGNEDDMTLHYWCHVQSGIFEPQLPWTVEELLAKLSGRTWRLWLSGPIAIKILIEFDPLEEVIE
jgi:hypothetical protein